MTSQTKASVAVQPLDGYEASVAIAALHASMLATLQTILGMLCRLQGTA